jgi:hypothetical protein
MSFAASRRLRLLRIPIRARAKKKKDIAAGNGSAVVPAAHVHAYGVHEQTPTNRHRADRFAASAAFRLVPVFQSLEIMLRMSSKAWKTPAVAFRTLDGL